MRHHHCSPCTVIISASGLGLLLARPAVIVKPRTNNPLRTTKGKAKPRPIITFSRASTRRHRRGPQTAIAIITSTNNRISPPPMNSAQLNVTTGWADALAASSAKGVFIIAEYRTHRPMKVAVRYSCFKGIRISPVLVASRDRDNSEKLEHFRSISVRGADGADFF